LPSSPEAAVRLPSVVAGTVGVLAVACLGPTVAGVAAGGAALILATSFEWMRSATSARVDMLLSAGMTLVLLGWATRLAGGARAGTGLLVGLGAVLAVLAKGPIGAAFPATALVVTAIVLRDRTLLWLLLPLLAGTAAAGLWYVVAWLTHGRAFLDIVLAENLGRFVDTTKARTGHAHGPLFLLGIAVVGLLPWTPLLPVTAAPGAVPPRVRALLLAWVATIVAVVAVSTSKRAVYLLPAFPAVALLVAGGLTDALSPRLTRLLRVTTACYAPVLAFLALGLLAMVCGIDVAAPFEPMLDPADRVAMQAVAAFVGGARPPLVGVAFTLLGLAVAIAALRSAERWTRLVAPVAAVAGTCALVFQLGIHPAVGRARGFADFLPRLGTTLPPGEPLYAYFPVDPSVRFYAPRPVVNWKERPADRDVYLLAWEREVDALPVAARPMVERLAVSDAQHGSRGALVLLRVPRGVLPPRRARRAGPRDLRPATRARFAARACSASHSRAPRRWRRSRCQPLRSRICAGASTGARRFGGFPSRSRRGKSSGFSAQTAPERRPPSP